MNVHRPEDGSTGSEPLVADRLAQGVVVDAAVSATPQPDAVTADDGAARSSVRPPPALGDASGIDLVAGANAADAEIEADAYLPDPEADVSIDDCIDIVDRFLALQIANVGELAAPASSLGDDPRLIATAIDRCGGLPPGEGETSQQTLQSYQMLIEALVDLQAFVPDDEAMAVRRWDGRGKPRDPGAAAEPAVTVIRRIRGAQAAAIQWVRDDPSVIGNLNAIRDIDVRIGDSRAAFRAVDAYRSGQVGGFSMMVIWPVSAGIGALVGSFVFGPSLLVIGALAAAWLAAPAYGWAVGAISSAIDQAVLTSGSAMIVPLRLLSTALGAVLLFASPAIIAMALMAIASRVGLP